MEGNLNSPDSGVPVIDWLIAETNCSPHAARQAAEYVAAQQAAVQVVPTQATVVFERFFDDTGGMQLVVHAPFGARINKAWGWAMRKRFCRSFDFELQATADDNGFILSLGPQHSFPIESLFPMLRPDNVRGMLEQALLITPTFHQRWRWNASRALQMERMRNGKKVPPALQRFRAQDLLTAVFPKLTGCQEEHTGDHEIPDHPLVQQTMHDCLTEALDIEALIELLGRVERGEITFVARDTREPSPFAYELLNANPYAFLDGGEIQERRTQMAQTQRHLTIESVRDLGRLDPAAIATVVEEAQPLVRNADELHDLLQSRYLLPVEGPGAKSPESRAMRGRRSALDSGLLALDSLFHDLVADGRATEVTYLDGRRGWVATERWPAVRFLFPEATCRPEVVELHDEPLPAEPSDVRVALLRNYMETCGPVTAAEISEQLSIAESQVTAALESLEGEGCVLRGRFRDESSVECRVSSVQDIERSSGESAAMHSTLNSQLSTLPEWCHRRLLQRIHRLTVSGLRKEIQPVDVPTYFRYLLRHQGVVGETRREGANGLYEVLGQLQGLDIPALAWEQEVLPARVQGYRREWLDELCLTGEVGWGRMYPPPRDPERSRPMSSITRVAPVSIFLREDLDWLLTGAAAVDIDSLSSVGQQVLELLQQRGAMFATDILTAAQLLPT
ncbi:MAG: DEAD/DEAH box helicase, partial [Planctomycetaceae bacterium]